jgi:hypothetical protein
VKLRILRGSPVAAAALAAGLLAAAAPAQAWNADTHEAIARAAFLISPDAASRVPADQLAAFFRELREPDPFDRMCERHRGPGARLDAAAEAEKAYRELGSSDASPYNRARLIARYLHYAADCAEPAAIAEGRRLPDFFANKNLVVFRQARPLAVPIAAALRDSSKRASWADDTPGAYSGVFRQAVNLTLDALLGLPGRLEAASEEPVVFVVNRLDSGFGALDERKVTVYHDVTINQRQAWVGLDATLKQGAEGFTTPDIMKLPGLHVVEWTPHAAGENATVTALLYNHQEFCASGVALKSAGWSMSVPGEIPPESVALVALQSPSRVALASVKATWASVACTSKARSENVFDAHNGRVVEGGGVSVPRFDLAKPLDLERRSGRVISR